MGSPEKFMATFGRYFLMDELHSDSVSRSVRARHAQLEGGNKLLEVRIFSAEITADHRFLEGFRAEMKTALGLNHPSIVQIYDCGTAKFKGQKCAYVVTEHLVGRTLTDLLNHLYTLRKPGVANRIPIQVVSKLVDTLARTLAYAHQFKDPLTGYEAAVVHRDFSPESVFLTFDGFVKVSGFGTAQAHEQIERTFSGSSGRALAGFLAPEQLESESRVSPRVDQFALAAIVWEMLAGQRLFEAATPNETIAKIRDEKFRIPAPSLFNPSLTREIDAALLRALSRDPSQRFESIEFFRRALCDALASLVKSQAGPAAISLESYIGGIFSDSIKSELALIQSLSREAEAKIRSDLSSVDLKLAEDSDAALPELITAPSGPASPPLKSPVNPPLRSEPAMDMSFGSGVIQLQDEDPKKDAKPPPAPVRPDVQHAISIAKATPPSHRPGRRRRSLWRVVLAGALFGVTAYLWVSPVKLDGLVNAAYNARYRATDPLLIAAYEAERKQAQAGGPTAPKTRGVELKVVPQFIGGTRIKNNGKYILPTFPVSQLELPTDSKSELSVQVLGFKEWKRVLTVSEVASLDAESQRIEAVLEPDQYGMLSIDSEVSGQGLMKNQNLLFEFDVPITEMKFPPGRYDLLVQNQGLGLQRRFQVQIDEGKILRVQVDVGGAGR